MTSLAEFIQQKREKAGLSITGLANKANIKLEILEDIDYNFVLMNSSTTGNKLPVGLIPPLRERHPVVTTNILDQRV